MYQILALSKSLNVQYNLILIIWQSQNECPFSILCEALMFLSHFTLLPA